MVLTDDELLDFDEKRLADYDPVKAERALAEVRRRLSVSARRRTADRAVG